MISLIFSCYFTNLWATGLAQHWCQTGLLAPNRWHEETLVPPGQDHQCMHKYAFMRRLVIDGFSLKVCAVD